MTIQIEQLSLKQWQQSSRALDFFDPKFRSGLWIDYIENRYSPNGDVVMFEVSQAQDQDQDQQVVCHLLTKRGGLSAEIYVLNNIFMPNRGNLTNAQLNALLARLPKLNIITLDDESYLVQDSKTMHWWHPFLMGKGMHIDGHYLSSLYECLRFDPKIPMLELPEDLTVNGVFALEESEQISIPQGLTALELRLHNQSAGICFGDNLKVARLSISNKEERLAFNFDCTFGENCVATHVYFSHVSGDMDLSGLTITDSLAIHNSYCSSISNIKARRFTLNFGRERSCVLKNLQIEDDLIINNSLFAEIGPSVSCSNLTLHQCARTGSLRSVTIHNDLLISECSHIAQFAPNLVIGNDFIIKDRLSSEFTLPDYGIIYGDIVIPPDFSIYIPKTFSCLGEVRVQS